LALEASSVYFQGRVSTLEAKTDTLEAEKASTAKTKIDEVQTCADHGIKIISPRRSESVGEVQRFR